MKIEKYFDKKEKKDKFRTRFQLNNKEFYPSADTRKKLNEIIDEIRAQEHRSKYDLVVPRYSPELAELLKVYSAKIVKRYKKVFFERVSEVFLSLVPDGIKITELKKAHFQKYIDLRLSQTGKNTGHSILPESIDKELYSLSAALSAAPLYFPELDDYRKPEIPKAKAKGTKKRQRERLVNPAAELHKVLKELREPKLMRRTSPGDAHLRRLADELEFKYETGLRRKEVARLKWIQYHKDEPALRNVRRWKTDTVTKFFPLSERAFEIVESRVGIVSEYIFTTDGESRESDYRTLKTVCAKLGINYGRGSEDGWIMHDLRHNFASEIILNTDIKTASQLLGHSNVSQTSVYLQTNEERLRSAVQKGKKKDLKREAASIYKGIKRGKIKLKTLVEMIENLARK